MFEDTDGRFDDTNIGLKHTKGNTMTKLIAACLLAAMIIGAPNIDAYTLPGSFGFYKGSVPMSEIRSITFSRENLDEYDECWNADLNDSGNIKGYREGTDVVIVGDHIYANPRCSYMFATRNSYGHPLWYNLTEINGLELLNTSRAENMKFMFNATRCEELDGIGQWDVSNVTAFTGMFQGSDNSGDIPLRYLDIGQWDTSSAVNMSHMFYGCGLMTHIPIETWDISNVTTFSHMFADCYSLRDIDFSDWDTTSAVSFDAFLNDCHSLTTIDVSGLDTASCEQFSQMFEACTNLEYIYGLEKWDVSNASYYAFSETFHQCHNLKELDLSSWRADRVDNTARMFKDCCCLTGVDISGLRSGTDVIDTEMFDGTSMSR